MNEGRTQAVHGTREAEIASYLAATPGFFERHAELLASIQLTSPHGQRAVSLQERQMQMLRERIRGLERKIIEMIRAGQENMGLADRLDRFVLQLLGTTDRSVLPGVIVETLKDEFLVPQVAIRLWGLGPTFGEAPFAREVSDDVKSFTTSLSQPYCGVDTGFEATEWLDDPAAVRSLALIPLHHAGTAFGLLVLASPDPTRYAAEMGTEFLTRIGELAGAALARLRAG